MQILNWLFYSATSFWHPRKLLLFPPIFGKEVLFMQIDAFLKKSQNCMQMSIFVHQLVNLSSSLLQTHIHFRWS